jgi:hypothetical protein
MTKNSKNLLLFFSLLTFFYACRLEDEILTSNSNAKLSFSKDTIFFDTIFTQTKSITRRVIVYNNNTNAVEVTNIRLGKDNLSPYSLIINGEITNTKDKLRILGKDSILILITANLPTSKQDLPLLMRDSILFSTNNNLQHVKLWAWGQDTNKESSIEITKPTIWSGIKPYIIADSLRILGTGSLTIEAGTTIYMNPNAKILVQGKLIMNGTCDKPIKITGSRNDGDFSDLAGQWQGIFFTVDSQGAEINFTEIRNGIFGLYVAIFDKDAIPDISLKNTKIENMSQTGIFAVDSDILMQNVLINNCFQRTFDVLRGGNYTLQHCTLVNLQRTPANTTPTIRWQNFVTGKTNTGQEITETADLDLTMENSIVWGTFKEEFFIANNTAANTKIKLNNNLLRTSTTNLNIYGIANKTSPINDNFSNEALRFPLFKGQKRSFQGKEYFALDSLSPAINMGKNLNIANDILCVPRDLQPDAGCYEWKK